MLITTNSTSKIVGNVPNVDLTELTLNVPKLAMVYYSAYFISAMSFSHQLTLLFWCFENQYRLQTNNIFKNTSYSMFKQYLLILSIQHTKQVKHVEIRVWGWNFVLLSELTAGAIMSLWCLFYWVMWSWIPLITKQTITPVLLTWSFYWIEDSTECASFFFSCLYKAWKISHS